MFRSIAAAAALALVAGVALPLLFPAPITIKGDPMPTLYADTVVAPLAARIGDQRRKAATLIEEWQRQHGSARDDTAFETWAAAQIPAPPPADVRAAELQQVRDLAATRTPAGRTAASWLETYGMKAVWKLYLSDYRDTVTAAASKTDKAALKTAVDIADTLTLRLVATYNSPAPYVVDPSLRTDEAVPPGATCPCSYPSEHAALSTAAVELLTSLDPRRAGEYDWMDAQVAYSRVYAASHFTSDILAGTLLGALVGDYIALTLGRPSPAAPTWPAPTQATAVVTRRETASSGG